MTDTAREEALGNSTLDGFTLLETGEWAGPIAEPEEEA
jgi:hypothetical protein